jgi:3-hydroxyisobutyrate dehydrogenase-like beta-hydroxyacid dehydrogenase
VQNKLRFLDAPVAGTLPQARNAELVFFVGGDEKDVQEVSPLLDMMGKKTMHLGESTKGSAFKMLVNAMLAQSMLIFSETILLGEKMGFDSNFLLDVMPNLVVSAPFTKAKAQMIKADDYQVMFPLELMHKDLHLATTTAYEMQQPLLMANLAKELYANASKQGMGRLDFAAIHDYLKKYH